MGPLREGPADPDREHQDDVGHGVSLRNEDGDRQLPCVLRA